LAAGFEETAAGVDFAETVDGLPPGIRIFAPHLAQIVFFPACSAEITCGFPH
jgi:hypothetical protein